MKGVIFKTNATQTVIALWQRHVKKKIMFLNAKMLVWKKIADQTRNALLLIMKDIVLAGTATSVIRERFYLVVDQNPYLVAQHLIVHQTRIVMERYADVSINYYISILNNRDNFYFNCVIGCSCLSIRTGMSNK